jgi:hypothetical protein
VGRRTQAGLGPAGDPIEYLARYPKSIRQAVFDAAKELEIAFQEGGLDDLAQEIVQMFLDFAALGLEDIVEMYPFHNPVRPGERRSAHFHEYIRLRVKACIMTMPQTEPTGTDDSGESLGS